MNPEPDPGRRRFSLALAAAGTLMAGETFAQAATPGSAGAIARSSFRTSDGVTLSYLETSPTGERDALTIVLLPGWCMPASIWQAQILAFAPYYRTLALDPRGQGESEVPDHGYTAPRRVADVQEFIAAAVPANSKVLLTGWSLAALEGLEYVKTAGEGRLAGLALIDSSVGEQQARPAGGSGGDGGFKQRLRSDREKMLNEFVHAIFARPRPEAEIQALVAGALRMRAEDSVALLSYPFPREHWKIIAHGFSKPLLYAVTPQFAVQAENLKKNRPATRIEIFRGAGHAMFVDEPERFNALLLDFAGSLK
jgi:microsomal epoxide hydrolase